MNHVRMSTCYNYHQSSIKPWQQGWVIQMWNGVVNTYSCLSYLLSPFNNPMVEHYQR